MGDLLSKPRMLFLDDEEWRHDFARKLYGRKYDLFQPHGLDQFRACLRRERFEVMSLDHDLGDDRAGTGMDAVNEICALPQDKRPSIVIVHSWNVPASMRMVTALTVAGFRVHRKPFSAKESA